MSFPNLASETRCAQLCTPHGVGMNDSWRNVVRDPDKLDGIVNSVAHCMSRLLSIRDPEVDGGSAPLGRVLYEEKEHLPSKAQLDEVERIARAMSFVENAYTTATELRAAANGQTNVLLARFSQAETFEKAWNFNRPTSLGSEDRAHLKVGALRHLMYVDVLTQVQRWLLECDAAMMIAYNDTTRDDHGDENTVLKLALDLAVSIAKRLTLTPEDTDALLSTEKLQARAMKEITGTAVESDQHHRNDLKALKCMYILAQEGPSSPTGKQILQNRLSYLQYIVCSPPVELGLTGSNAQQMNMRLFSKACAPHLDDQVRVEMIQTWHELHGAFAATAASQAIQKLKLWSMNGASSPTFCQVIHTPGQQVSPDASDMPRMNFVHTTHKWTLVSKATPRTSYDWTRRRCVRLSSLVLQLLAHGALERGVVSSKVVDPIATQAALTARVVLRLLDQKRDQYSLGTRLLLFCGNVSDFESHLSADVANALANVSRFSLLELLSVFSRESPAMRMILPDLTFRIRIAMGNYQTAPVVPRKYIAFAFDAMPFLLPILSSRRNRLGLSPLQPSNPVCDLLRALPAAKGWTPLCGTLRLSLEDLKDGPALLPAVLQELARRELLVEFKRPYDPVLKRKAAKKAFVFDSAQLVAVLSGYAIVSRK